MPRAGRMARFLALLLFLTFAAGASLALAQRKPYDIGNCYQWKGCRGDSIGNMWMYDPDRCKAMGGKSWMDETGQCHDLPDGAQVVRIP